jgi:hypothetical protein
MDVSLSHALNVIKRRHVFCSTSINIPVNIRHTLCATLEVLTACLHVQEIVGKYKLSEADFAGKPLSIFLMHGASNQARVMLTNFVSACCYGRDGKLSDTTAASLAS